MDVDKKVNVEEIEIKKMEKTELEWDKYIDYLIEAIDESNFMKRSEIKPMATPKDDLETHLTSRATHVRNAANIAKRIAKGLDLDYEYAYAGMLMHDAGHPFSAHDGEETFTHIGEIFNVQFFHHNAKGVEVIESENICEKAIAKIPNIKNKPELRKKLQEEFSYFLDIVVSHDGEASAKDMNKKEDYYPDMQTAVRTKVTSATAKNKYKCIAQTPEGKIAKYADVIAYLATDIRDGFRLGIYKDFIPRYLELFGEMFADDYADKTEDKIQIAKNIIDQIKDEKLRGIVQDAQKEENREIIKIANQITGEITEKDIQFETDYEKVNEIVEAHIEEYKKQKEQEGMSDEDKMFLNSDLQKIREFVGKKLRVRSTVVAEVTTRMQEFFINDLLKNSRTTGQLQFSPLGQRLFFAAKQINYDTYVPKTKWKYQQDAQPNAALKLVETCAKSMIRTGVVANQFYNRTIRKQIENSQALAYCKTEYKDPKECDGYKKQQEIRDIKILPDARFTTSGNRNETKARRELFSNIYEYVQNGEDTFATKYMNTFYAIETQIRNKVQKALDSKYETKITGQPKDFEQLYRSKVDEDIESIRQKIKAEYGTLDSVTPEQQEKIAQELIDRERQKMEEKMAIQLSIDYLAGMTDRGFNELAIRTGYMKKEDLKSDRVDPETALKENKKVQELSRAMQEDERE